MAQNITIIGPQVSETLTVGSGITSGDPVAIGGIVGTALVDYGAEVTGKASILLNMHIADHTVEAKDADGNNAVALGDAIYYDSAETIKLNKDNVNGVFWGYALEAITAGSSDTINVLCLGGGAGLPVVRQEAHATSVIDLSAAAVADIPIFHTSVACTLLNLYFVYPEATSADAGVVIDVGKGSDDDYYFTGASDVSQSAYAVVSKTLLQTVIAAGETVICNCAGSKTGTGTLLVVIEYALA